MTTAEEGNGVKKERERRRITSTERSALLRYAAALSIWTEPGCEDFIKGLPYGGRDLETVRRVTLRLWTNAMAVIDKDQLRQILMNVEAASVTVGITRMRAAEHASKYGQFITHAAATALTEAAAEKCSTCMLDRNGARRCELRAALDEMNIVDTAENSSVCKYRMF